MTKYDLAVVEQPGDSYTAVPDTYIEDLEHKAIDRANDIYKLENSLAAERARANRLEKELKRQKKAHEKDMAETLCGITAFCCIAIIVAAIVQKTWWLCLAPAILLYYTGKKGGMWK